MDQVLSSAAAIFWLLTRGVVGEGGGTLNLVLSSAAAMFWLLTRGVGGGGGGGVGRNIEPSLEFSCCNVLVANRRCWRGEGGIELSLKSTETSSLFPDQKTED